MRYSKASKWRKRLARRVSDVKPKNKRRKKMGKAIRVVGIVVLTIAFFVV
jgi:hypothetical protein